MTHTHGAAPPRSSNDPLIDWLLDGDPSIRWQVMRDLTDTPHDIVAAERARVASEGWGPRLGVRSFLVRLRRWMVSPRWYVLALVPSLALAGTVLLLSLASSDFRPALFDSNATSSILLGALVPSLIFGFCEEVGWSGFAVPRLRARHGILTTGLTVGTVWGAWHFPLFWERDSFSAVLPFTILLARLFSWLPPFRVLMVWMYDRTESLPVVMFMHAALVFTQLTLFPAALRGARVLTAVLATAVTVWLVLAVVALDSHGGRLRREPLRPTLT
ncbi:MAG TPA: CPBP family intramembrane glutamic endopeptidase [Gemmatimonadaceae bacterium]|nr:CPBP family intramembrane glutamic endopeptidase [Gemmatimonadaceae bacterium]